MSENPSSPARKHILFALKLAAVMIGAALLLALARNHGWIGEVLVARANNVIIGLALAAYGNVMPKMLDGPPLRSIRHATLRQAVARASGRTMTLAFATWAALWAFAPLQFARVGAMAAVGISVALMLGYTVWKCVAFDASSSD